MEQLNNYINEEIEAREIFEAFDLGPIKKLGENILWEVVSKMVKLLAKSDNYKEITYEMVISIVLDSVFKVGKNLSKEALIKAFKDWAAKH